jgi:hypothetical protein
MGTTINPRKGCWINYQLRLNGITQAAAALRADCNNRTVSDFLRGRKNGKATLPVNVARSILEARGVNVPVGDSRLREPLRQNHLAAAGHMNAGVRR